MPPPPFNPSQQLWGWYPLNTSKPTSSVNYAPDNGCNGYLRGVLRFKTGAGCSCLPNYGPWTFSGGTGSTSVRKAVIDLQTWVRNNADPNFVVDGIVGPATWAWIDLLAGQ